ncbi:hypothetical protein DFH06DRAFT_1465071 [Mycena polygramma]|nr:hypothetical protein DFH06DRAFT_1465071 [Mycena polygramma]
MQLPQELIEAIVEQVEGKDCLQSCSLTARVFLNASQRCLFRSMSLRWDIASRNTAAFDRALDFINQLPHLVPYVREVTLDIPTQCRDQKTLENILRLLGDIEHLTIHGHCKDWCRVIPPLASTISSVISRPSLQRLNLFSIWHIPPALVFHAVSSVRVLSLYAVSADPGQVVPSDIGANTHLEGLILPSCVVVQALLRSYKFLLAARNLRHLAVYVHETGHHRALTAASSLHLRDLELECGAFSIPLDLPHLPALRSLSLSFMVSESAPGVWTLPEMLRPTITTLPTAVPVLDKLTFTVLFLHRQTDMPWQDRSALPYFESSSSSNYRQQFPHLRRICCSLADPSAPLSGHFERAFVGFAAYMESKLYAAYADGIVTVRRGIQTSRFNSFDHLR